MRKVEEAYIVMQDECGIEVGDTVKVLRKAKDNEWGWNNGWDNRMDWLIGKEAEVAYIFESGISLKCETVHFGFPFFVLEKLPKPHWRDTVSPENPVLCYVQDHAFSDGNAGKIMFVSEYAKDAAFPYMVSEYAGFRHAKRIPKSMIESMLKAYDETSEDE